MTSASPPANHAGVTPYLSVAGADAAIAWYQRVLGARLVYRMEWQGRVGHAELALGGGQLMLADEYAEMDLLGPVARGGTTVSLLLHVDDVDAVHARALAGGAAEIFPPELKPWGDRSSQITDPFGHCWTLATRVEEVPWDELDRRMAALGH